jgi:hypothetical protein
LEINHEEKKRKINGSDYFPIKERSFFWRWTSFSDGF